MSGGGQSGGSSTTVTGLPRWERPAQHGYLNALLGQIFPNGIGGGIAQYPQGLNQQVAPFTDAQNQALQLGFGQTGNAQNLVNQGANINSYFASGAANNPSTNPNLLAYANAAMGPLVQNYSQATQPALLAQAERSGSVDSSGYNQAQSNAQYNLGQGMATTLANIYEPAFQLGQQEQFAGAQAAGQQAQNLYLPTQGLFGLGSAQQQQQQNVFNAGTQNAQQQANWPFNLLSQLGAGLGLASGGGGFSTATMNPAGGK